VKLPDAWHTTRGGGLLDLESNADGDLGVWALRRMKIGDRSARMKVVGVYRTEARVRDEIGQETIFSNPFLDLGPSSYDISGDTEIWGSRSRQPKFPPVYGPSNYRKNAQSNS
jgi:hypothetical protein